MEEKVREHLNLAKEYLEASKKMYEAKEGFFNVIMNCSAFSVELYLKFLTSEYIHKEFVWNKTHSLKYLVKRLDKETKRKIDYYFFNGEHFFDPLYEKSEEFIVDRVAILYDRQYEERYIYEKNRGKFMEECNGLITLAEAMDAYINATLEI